MRYLPNSLREIAGVRPASQLERPPVATVSCGVAVVDTLTGGLHKGGLTEICGNASSGRTSLMIAAMAATTARQELCVLIDATDCFDPRSAATAGIDLDRLLWVRCNGAEPLSSSRGAERETSNLTSLRRALYAKQEASSIMPAAKFWYGRSPARSEREPNGHGLTRIRADQSGIKNQKSENENAALRGEELHRGQRDGNEFRLSEKRSWARPVEQALKVADLLLQGGGFGLVVLDLGDVPMEIARRIPLASWFRFRRAVENTPTVLLTIVQESCAKTCASLVLRTAVSGQRSAASENQSENQKPTHARVFGGLESTVEVVRSRVEEQHAGKKPVRGVSAEFSSRTEWAGKNVTICWR
jgi:recombination protein RecA